MPPPHDLELMSEAMLPPIDTAPATSGADTIGASASQRPLPQRHSREQLLGVILPGVVACSSDPGRGPARGAISDGAAKRHPDAHSCSCLLRALSRGIRSRQELFPTSLIA